VLLVSGSFQFEPSTKKKKDAEGNAGPPTVKLHVDVNRRGNKPKSSPKTIVFLTETLPNRLMTKDALKIEDPLEFSQLQWLEEQAAQFYLRGEWQYSASLCEAALLLDPKNVDVRRRSIRCYLQTCSKTGLANVTARDSLKDPKIVADVGDHT